MSHTGHYREVIRTIPLNWPLKPSSMVSNNDIASIDPFSFFFFQTLSQNVKSNDVQIDNLTIHAGMITVLLLLYGFAVGFFPLQQSSRFFEVH